MKTISKADIEVRERELSDFVASIGIAAKWDAVRRLMASRRMQALAEGPKFRAGFQQLRHACVDTVGLDQLLAIALVVRISEFLKKDFKQQAAEILSAALVKAPAGAWSISESKFLPPEAKPSEIRENIALALEYASGPWVVEYIIEALAREDRSQRCRLELCRQLIRREPNIVKWFELLNARPWQSILRDNASERVARLRDLAMAVAATIRANRGTAVVSADIGPSITIFSERLVRITPGKSLPPRLIEAAVELVGLLEEIFATEYTLVREPETYTPLTLPWRWWQGRSYPEELGAALTGTVRKLRSAIIELARSGKRSDQLASRLSQALGSARAASELTKAIADAEPGLDPEIDDWLRGISRDSSITSKAIASLLTGTSMSELVKSIAPLLLDCANAAGETAESDKLAATLRRISGRIDGLAIELGLKIVGRVGETVEFNPKAHRTADGTVPPEPIVTIVSPMVIRKRADGSEDVIEKAIVS